MRNLLHALKMFVWLTLVTGVIYPLFITLVAQATMQHKANGSILYEGEKAVGSELIAQKFEDPRYFWGRPSAVDYSAMPSGASNLGPTSSVLKKIVEARKEVLSRYQEEPIKSYPSELLFASASGIDPHISPEAAYFQIERIVKARNIDPQKINLKGLIDHATRPRFIGFIGTPCVNVLLLNQALDAAGREGS